MNRQSKNCGRRELNFRKSHYGIFTRIFLFLCSFLLLFVPLLVKAQEQGQDFEARDTTAQVILEILSKTATMNGRICPISYYARTDSEPPMAKTGDHGHRYLVMETLEKFHLNFFPVLNLDIQLTTNSSKGIDGQYYMKNKGEPRIPRVDRYLSPCENQVLHVEDRHLWLPWLDAGFPSNQDLFIFIGGNEKIYEAESAGDEELFEIFRTRAVQGLKYKIAVLNSPRGSRILMETFDLGQRGFILECLSVLQLFPEDQGQSDREIDLYRSNNLRNGRLSARTYSLNYMYTKTAAGKELGMAQLLREVLSKAYNVTMSLDIETSFSQVQLPNGSWEGPYRDIFDGTLDLYMTSRPSSKKQKYFSHAYRVMTWNAHFYGRRPSQQELKLTAFTAQFSNVLWLWIFGAMILVMLLTWAHIYALVHMKMKIKVENKDVYIHTVSMSPFIIAIAPLLCKGVKIPKVGNFPLFFSTWLFGSFILNAYYNNDLLATITAPKVEKVPKNALELENSQYTINFQYYAGGSLDQFFKRSKDPSVIRIRERLVKFPPKKNLECLVQAATQPSTVCITWNIIIDPSVAQNLSVGNDANRPLLTQSESLTSSYGCPVLRRNSKYLNTVDEASGRLHDMGIFKRSYDLVVAQLRMEGFQWMKVQRQHHGPQSKLYEQLKASAGENLDARGRSRVVHPFKINVLLVPFLVLGCGFILGGISFTVGVFTAKYPGIILKICNIILRRPLLFPLDFPVIFAC